MTKLLDTNYKLDKAVRGIRITGLSMAPHTTAGGPTVCKHSTVECRANCLGTETGRNIFAAALAAKVARTRLWHSDPAVFKHHLRNEVGSALRSAIRAGMKLAVRLNVYSDLPWEVAYPGLFEAYPEVQFYDYTKVPGRYRRPSNYHLTYSYSGSYASATTALDYQGHGVNTAVVMDTARGQPLPGDHALLNLRLPVVDGDLNDYRPADPKGCVVGLRFKGGRERLHNIKRFVVEVPHASP